MRRAADILSRLLDRGTADNAELYGAFFKGWRRIAGEQIAAHSSVSDVRNGMVVVEADHPGWIQLIQLHQERILAELRREYPTLGIHGLRLQLPRQGRAGQPNPAPSLHDQADDAAWTSTVEPSETTREQEAHGESSEIQDALGRLGKAIRARKSGDG